MAPGCAGTAMHIVGVTLRYFGLLLAAVVLARLAWAYPTKLPAQR